MIYYNGDPVLTKVAIVDGVDFSVSVGLKYSKLFYSHKVNVFKNHAIRAQIRIDTLWGLFRDMLIEPAGINNDQSMVADSPWNQSESKLQSDGQSWGADGGYSCTDNLVIVTPATATDIINDPELCIFNQEFNHYRKNIEREFAQLKNRFEILFKPFDKDLKHFGKILGLCLKMMNRYWRLNGHFFNDG